MDRATCFMCSESLYTTAGVPNSIVRRDTGTPLFAACVKCLAKYFVKDWLDKDRLLNVPHGFQRNFEYLAMTDGSGGGAQYYFGTFDALRAAATAHSWNSNATSAVRYHIRLIGNREWIRASFQEMSEYVLSAYLRVASHKVMVWTTPLIDGGSWKEVALTAITRSMDQLHKLAEEINSIK